MADLALPPHRQTPYKCDYTHAGAAAADVTVKLDKIEKRMRFDGAKICNPTGLAEHATAIVEVKILKNSTVVASWSTDSDLSTDDMSIPADAFLDLTLQGESTDRIFEQGDVLSFSVDVTGGTLPANTRVVVRGTNIGG